MEDNIELKRIETVDQFADPEKVEAERRQLQEIISEQHGRMEESLAELGAVARENSWRIPSGVRVNKVENDETSVEVFLDTDERPVQVRVPLAQAASVAKRLAALAIAEGGVVADANDKDRLIHLSLATKLELARLFGGESVTLDLDFDAIEEEEDKSLILPYGV